MPDIGDLHNYLGIQVSRSTQGLFLNQSKYATDLLVKLSMADCNSITIPMFDSKLLAHEGQSLSNPTQFHNLASALKYLTITWLDIAFVVNNICQFMPKTITSHIQVAKHILRYVKGIVGYGLHL